MSINWNGQIGSIRDIPYSGNDYSIPGHWTSTNISDLASMAVNQKLNTAYQNATAGAAKNVTQLIQTTAQQL